MFYRTLEAKLRFGRLEEGLMISGNRTLDIVPTSLEIRAMSDIDISNLKREAMKHKYLASKTLNLRIRKSCIADAISVASTVVSLTLIVWECLIALKNEVRFIWRLV